MIRDQLTRANSLNELMNRTSIERKHIAAAMETVALDMKIEFAVPTESGMPVPHMVLIEDQKTVNALLGIIDEYIMDKNDKVTKAFDKL